MKTQHFKLDFSAQTVIELTTKDLSHVFGGSGILGGNSCSGCACIQIEKRFEFIEDNIAQVVL